MYFDDITLFDYKNNIDNMDKLYAHKDGENIEFLDKHMNLCVQYLDKIIRKKNLDLAFLNIEDGIFEKSSSISKRFFREILYNSVYCHDLGKSNPDFQTMRMSNKEFVISKKRNPNHSLTSSVIYFNYYAEKLWNLHKDIDNKDFMLLFLLLIINSYAISKHHGYLDEINKYIVVIKNALKEEYKPEYINYLNRNFTIIQKLLNKISFIKIMHDLEEKEKWISVTLYIYSRVIFSVIVTCDFYATSQFQSKREVDDFGLMEDVEKYLKLFNETKVCKNIERARIKGINNVYKNSDINMLRTKMFLESENNLLENIDNDIFFLEAPTGSGKTNVAINLSLKLIEHYDELNKIFYIFPFNTLVEQTKKTLFDTFENHNDIKNNIAVINSITSIKTCENEGTGKTMGVGEKDNIDYEKSLLSRQFLHYPINITTHVKLFNILFGTDRESVFPLLHLANSVVVLDEIQSYKNSIWKEFIIFLKAYSKLLNIKIIIMSATLPNLSLLSNDQENFLNLINNREIYYNNPLFKNRVEIDYSLLSICKEEIMDSLTEKIIHEYIRTKNNSKLNGKVLIEFISKKRAANFYNIFKSIAEINKLDAKILLLTGYDSRYERHKIVEEVKTGKNIILIATQVIEAGVDIDMDVGFKNISMLDSEEQFLGRINRSCKKQGCKAYFFNLDDSSKIYKDDVRNLKEITLSMNEIRDILKNKAFDIFYNNVIKKIEEKKNSSTEKGIENFRTEILGQFKFIEIEKLMQLIEEKNKFTLFLNTEIRLDDGSILIGRDVWNNYYNVLSNKSLSYAERRVKLSEISEKMDYFTYEVNSISFSYNDRIGDLIYIEDGNKYLKDGKFNINFLIESNNYELI
ncbi:MAG: CRISPR-associated helicase Cas3' [Sedimentibacter sp.]